MFQLTEDKHIKQKNQVNMIGNQICTNHTIWYSRYVHTSYRIHQIFDISYIENLEESLFSSLGINSPKQDSKFWAIYRKLQKNTGYAPLEPQFWKMVKHRHTQMKFNGAYKKGVPPYYLLLHLEVARDISFPCTAFLFISSCGIVV